MLLPAFLLLMVAFWGCSTKKHPTLADGYDPTGVDWGQNQPCSAEGELKRCGRVEHTDGNYVTCSEGHTTCVHGKWSPCVGDHFTTKSLPNARLTRDGFSLLGTTGSCGNLCDPSCVSTTPDPTEVTAPGVTLADGGGITLEESDAGLTTPGAGQCTGLQCQLVTCAGAATTSISGTVYDPAGNTPLFDANVYIPLDPDAPLPAFGSGATCDTCGGAATLDAIRAAQTDAAGNFTLNDIPAGTNIPIVVQIGKWRREIVLSTITQCVPNEVKANCTTADPADCVLRLPRNKTDGYDPVAKTYSRADLPKIAIATGGSDPFDCLLLKAGIDPAEIGDSSSSARIHYYTSNGNKLDATSGSVVAGSTLWNDPAAMKAYDVILLPCEGSATDKQSGTNTPYQNLINYANAGGRAFITHFGYSWIQYAAGKSHVPPPDDWSAVANWTPTGAAMTSSVNTQDPLTGTVNTSFPKGAIYSKWLKNVGASSTASRLTIHEGRQDLTSIGPDTQPWMTARDKKYVPYPNYTNLFTFNTPYGAPAANQCGRVVFSDFHVSANALVPATNTCLSDVDCGYTATCTGATVGAVGQCSEPCQTAADCPNTGFACPGATTGTCQQTTCAVNSDCGTGRTCRGGTCTCAGDSDCDGGTCAGATCSPTACASSATCGLGTCGGGTCSVVGCHKNADCGLGTCGGAGKNGTCAAGFACHTDSQCGPSGTCGSGTSSTAGNCSTNATVCHTNANCDSASCGAGTGSTAGNCSTNSVVCHKNSECDSNSCGVGTGFTGTCANSNATVCHTNANCDSGSCGAGTGATAGTCSTNSTVCHTNATCDSGSCGVGTGFTGTCSITGTTVCHTNANCDSGFCGSGTGSTAGTCSTNSAVCHTDATCDSGSCGIGTGFTGLCAKSTTTLCHGNADCDSGSCGTGTGSTAGVCSASTCHSNADCDSGACGSGTGSAVGSCSTGSAICHANTDCDSGACGSGTGSALGVCTAGTCTTNAQCGTSGTCTGGKCVAGSCAKDSVCGTALGVCTGAKCSTKACAADSVCGVSNLCNGAKCSTKACFIDSNCTVAGSVCNGAKCSTAPTCSIDSNCTASNLCNGAKCTVKTCAGDSACGVSNLCNGAKCSTAPTCSIDSNCPASNLCNGAKCTVKTCAGDSACGVSNLCNNAKCSTASVCSGDAGCPSSNLCTGSKCNLKTCAGDAGCPVGNLCNGAKCATKTCAGDAGCPVGNLCNGAKCSTSSCGLDTQCPLAVCTGAKCTPPASCGAAAQCGTGAKCTGSVCSQVACTADADCGSGTCGGKCGPFVCSKDADCPSGTCNAGTCTCTIG
jgi:hypothetical protein